jgi:hypothetical protein
MYNRVSDLDRQTTPFIRIVLFFSRKFKKTEKSFGATDVTFPSGRDVWSRQIKTSLCNKTKMCASSFFPILKTGCWENA